MAKGKLKQDDSCDIIIAVRDELPANLEWTVCGCIPSLSPSDNIVIAADGQPQNLPPIEHKQVSYIFPHEEHRGPGATRHAAIMASKANTIILLDGHMTVPLGFVATIKAHLDKHPEDVTCAHMHSLDLSWRVADPIRDFGGCYIALKTRETGPGGSAYWAMSGKWIDAPENEGPIPCIMGACYGMRREWYTRMGKPLSILRGWGQDEELLSLCSWLCGGRAYLLPITCGHVYAAPHTRERSDEGMDERNAAVNRYASIMAIPMPTETRDGLLAWLQRNPMRRQTAEIDLASRGAVIDDLRRHLDTHSKRTWAEMEKAGLIRTVGGKVEQILQIRSDDKRPGCPLCNPPHMVVPYSDEYWRCRKCGHKIPKARIIR